MEDQKICYHCECEIEDGEETQDNDGDYYCQDCRDNHLFYCEDCQEWYSSSDNESYYVDDKMYCENCFENSDGHFCEDCQEYHFNCTDVGGSSQYYWVCESCLLDNYFECCECNNYFSLDNHNEHNDNSYCNECYQDIPKFINDYSFKPEPIFYENTQEFNINSYFGIELEIDNGGKNEYNAEELLDIANNFDELLYIKEDGSISDGMELVSHPCSFEYHSKVFPWQKILKTASNQGYESHNAGTCGLHVHVSRTAFTNQEAGITKLLWIFEKFWDNILTFSRRTPEQVQRWAKNYGLEDSPEQLKHKADNAGGRYFAINLKNYHTVELRIFRGTLNYNTFLATLQFCNLLIDICNNWSLQDIAGITWNNLVDAAKTYTELTEYLISKKLA